jgi:biopolymer transport protein ExbD
MSTAKRRKRHSASNAYSEPDLPITPMLDMSFQLLFFFIMNFHPMPTEGQVEIFLPAEGEGATVTPPGEEIETYTLRLLTSDERAAGRQDIIAIEFNDGTPPAIRLGGAGTDPIAALEEKLMKMSKPADEKKIPKIKLECPEDLKYWKMLQVMEVCIKHGFKNVGPTLLKPDSIKKR